MEVQGPYDIGTLPDRAYSEETLLNYFWEHGLTTNMTRCTGTKDLVKALTYGSHTSSVKNKAFVGKELSEQLQYGNVATFTLSDVKHLQGL